MLYGNPPHPLYERAIRSHSLHNKRWNYPFYVLREDIAGGYWNKPAYLLHLLIAELAKPASQRLEWLMWVDADLVLINPSIPLSLFLPPQHAFPNAMYIGNKDHNGLNTGTFFLRVHPWSVKMLTKTMAFPLIHPETDLHTSVDQEAMKIIFRGDSPEDANSPEVGTSRGEVLYQPRVWYNTYEFHHGYEGRPGNLLVHFPGLEDDRWKHMSDWLDVLETKQADWDIPLRNTSYPQDVGAYWEMLSQGMSALQQAEELLWSQTKKVEGETLLRQEADLVREWARYQSDDSAKGRELVDRLRKAMPA